MCIYLHIYAHHHLLKSWESKWQPQSKQHVENQKVLVLHAPCWAEGTGVWRTASGWYDIKHIHGLVETRKGTKHWRWGAELCFWPPRLGLGLRAWLACGSLPTSWTHWGAVGQEPRDWSRMASCVPIVGHTRCPDWMSSPPTSVAPCRQVQGIMQDFSAFCASYHWVLNMEGGFSLPVENCRAKSHRKCMVGINRQIYLSLQPLLAVDVSWSSPQESEFLPVSFASTSRSRTRNLPCLWCTFYKTICFHIC